MPNSSGDLVTVWLRDEEELVRLTRHPDPDVRRWAADRWMALYPDHAHDRLAPLITDDDDEIRRDVALFLARSGDDKWRSVFRKGLELTSGPARVPMIEALGVLRDVEAVPALASMVRGARSGEELVALVQALGRFRVEGSWTALSGLLDLVDEENVLGATLVGILLGMGRRDDVPRMVARWRSWPASEAPHVLRAWLGWMDVDGPTRKALAALAEGKPSEVVAALGETDLDEDTLAALDAAWADSPRAFHGAVHGALLELLQERGDAVSAWSDAPLGSPTEDYRALVIGVDALLGSLRSQAGPVEHAHQEGLLALAALLAVTRREAEVDHLAAAEDPIAVAWALFSADREHISPAVDAVLEQLGDAAAEPLLAIATRIDSSWARVRAARRLEPIAQRSPGVLSAAVPALLVAARGAEWTTHAEALEHLICAIGHGAVPHLVQELRSGDADDVVVALLGELPSETSFRALTALAESTGVTSGIGVALTNLGDPRSIDLMAGAWDPGDARLAAMLDALCRLNDTIHPDREDWKRTLAQDRGRRALTQAALSQEPAES